MLLPEPGTPGSPRTVIGAAACEPLSAASWAAWAGGRVSSRRAGTLIWDWSAPSRSFTHSTTMECSNTQFHMCSWSSLTHFYSYVVFCFMNRTPFMYSFFCWWTFRLFQGFCLLFLNVITTLVDIVINVFLHVYRFLRYIYRGVELQLFNLLQSSDVLEIVHLFEGIIPFYTNFTNTGLLLFHIVKLDIVRFFSKMLIWRTINNLWINTDNVLKIYLSLLAWNMWNTYFIPSW